MKKYYLLIYILCLSMVGMAQQTPIFNHNFENPWLYNSAAISNAEFTTVSLLNRQQWVGFEGAPKTTVLGVSGKINEKHALGFRLMQDRENILKRTQGLLMYAYSIKLTEDQRLTFSAAGGLSDMGIDYTAVVAEESDDLLFLHGYTSTPTADVDVGIQYEYKKLRVGLAGYQLLGNGVEFRDQSNFRQSRYQVLRHFGAHLSYRAELGSDWAIEPLVIARSVQGMDVRADISARLIYDEVFWGGFFYRTQGSFGVLAGANIFENIGIGYSYEYPFALDVKQSGATHEVNLRWRFLGKEGGNKSAASRRKSKKAMSAMQKESRAQLERINELNQQIEQLSREVQELKKKESAQEQGQKQDAQDIEGLQKVQEEKLKELLEKELERLELEKRLPPSTSNQNIEDDKSNVSNEQSTTRSASTSNIEAAKATSDVSLDAYMQKLKRRALTEGKTSYLVFGAYNKRKDAEAYVTRMKSDFGVTVDMVKDENTKRFLVVSPYTNNLEKAVDAMEGKYEQYQLNGKPWVYEE